MLTRNPFRKLFCVSLTLVSLGLCATLRAAPAVTGEYLEARTCDVWTGPCFANGDLNLAGDQAVVAWVVQKGAWNGVSLDGLKIVAAIDSEGTLHTNAEGKVQAVVYVDEEASGEQAKALLDMAVQLAPKYLSDVVQVERKKISYSRSGAEAALEVGGGSLVKLKTKALSGHCDTVCGNEERAYPSVGKTTDVVCAKAVEHSHTGLDLNRARWSDPNKRSAMLGHFALAAAEA